MDFYGIIEPLRIKYKVIPKRIKFIKYKPERLIKSPFLYCVLFGFLVAGLAAFFVGKDNNGQAQEKNAIDKTPYFFSSAGPRAGAIDLSVVDGSVLQPQSPPFLVSGKALADLIGTAEGKQGIEEYVVTEGDTIASLSNKFGISVSTITEANNLTAKSVLKPGQTLIILPVSGLVHFVKSGETLNKLAILYKAKSEDIISANDVGSDGSAIFAGDILVIPGGVKPKAVDVKAYPKVAVSKSYFMVPIANAKKTQGLHWFNAVDFSNGSCGGPVVAAAVGTVQKLGADSISGNYINIIHSNGVVTYYGHLAKYAVSSGQKVNQGQIIGYIGHTGLTIPAGEAGCHVHFDVRFATNPFK
ncbi:MAG: M23 family metallopeptidase [bacterium]|nr:M23 family metallopeptidase [bacterium]